MFDADDRDLSCNPFKLSKKMHLNRFSGLYGLPFEVYEHL